MRFVRCSPGQGWKALQPIRIMWLSVSASLMQRPCSCPPCVFGVLVCHCPPCVVRIPRSSSGPRRPHVLGLPTMGSEGDASDLFADSDSAAPQSAAARSAAASSGSTAASDADSAVSGTFVCEQCEERLSVKCRAAKSGSNCKECKKVIDNAFKDAQRAGQLEFWKELRGKTLDFKRFLRTYSRVSGRGQGRGKLRKGFGDFDWAQHGCSAAFRMQFPVITSPQVPAFDSGASSCVVCVCSCFRLWR